jgi:hypothetical protein
MGGFDSQIIVFWILANVDRLVCVDLTGGLSPQHVYNFMQRMPEFDFPFLESLTLTPTMTLLVLVDTAVTDTDLHPEVLARTSRPCHFSLSPSTYTCGVYLRSDLSPSWVAPFPRLGLAHWMRFWRSCDRHLIYALWSSNG